MIRLFIQTIATALWSLISKNDLEKLAAFIKWIKHNNYK